MSSSSESGAYLSRVEWVEQLLNISQFGYILFRNKFSPKAHTTCCLTYLAFAMGRAALSLGAFEDAWAILSCRVE